VVLGGEAEHDTHPSSALLVIEVSVTTLREDRELLSIYAEASVAEAWIVNAADHCIEVYRSPQAGTYATMEQFGAGDIVTCASLPAVKVIVHDLFAGLPRG
jgi:Uma2 family endonuclease